MSSEGNAPADLLEAKSPYELRLNQSSGVEESLLKSALASGDVGFLHSFTTGSAVDGPGIRVVAWTAGCTWRCRFCHNPDTWSMRNGRAVSLERAVEELRKYRRGLQIMSGGFTLSGGEPLLQDRFAVKLFAAAQAMGVHTAIETNGFFGERLSDAELRRIDLVIMDIKTWDPQRHSQLTGQDIAPTLAFARRLADQHRPLWIRFVLIPGLTDDVENIRPIAEFAAGLGNVERVEVLPFHQMGRFKWHTLGLEYSLEQVQPPSPDQVAAACQIFRDAGLTAA